MTRTYLSDERDDYVPPPCPHCGGPTHVTWIDVTSRQDQPGTEWVPGTYRCAVDCLADGHRPVHITNLDEAFERPVATSEGDEHGPW